MTNTEFQEKLKKYVLGKKEFWLLIHKSYWVSKKYRNRYVKISSFRITKNWNLKRQSVNYFNY